MAGNMSSMALWQGFSMVRRYAGDGIDFAVMRILDSQNAMEQSYAKTQGLPEAGAGFQNLQWFWNWLFVRFDRINKDSRVEQTFYLTIGSDCQWNKTVKIIESNKRSIALLSIIGVFSSGTRNMDALAFARNGLQRSRSRVWYWKWGYMSFDDSKAS
jgi:hypothetical protein